MPPVEERLASVHLASFPMRRETCSATNVSSAEDSTKQQQDWKTCWPCAKQVMKALEEERNRQAASEKGLEAQVTITAADPVYPMLAALSGMQLALPLHRLRREADTRRGQWHGSVLVEVKKAEGAKCERCWNFSTHVGEDKNYPTVCERCSAVLQEIERGN